MKTITSTQNSLVKHWVKLRTNSQYREEHQAVFIEGRKQVAEAADIIARITTDPNGEADYLVSEEVFDKLSGMKSPEGIAAEVRLPPPATWTTLSRLLVLDGINDPGNLGTLLRTALALGWEGAFLLPGCCDPFNEKALSAARGATFKLPLCHGTWEDLRLLIDNHKLTAVVADLHGETPDTLSPEQPLALVLGNEAQGPCSETTKACGPITIPIDGMESLNVAVAGGILMFELRRVP